MTGMLQDLRHGARLLRRSPLFALTASLSLAIGIGANTAIFTVANALLLRDPVGVVEAGRLVDIGTARGDGGLNPSDMPHTSRFNAVRQRCPASTRITCFPVP